MNVYYRDEQVTLLLGDAIEVLRMLPDESVNCCVTSPPYYGLRDYGVAGQYGLEASVGEYVETMRQVFAEVRRVLAADGTLWLNLGDSYAYPPGSAGKQGNGQRADRTFTAEGLPGTRELPAKNLIGVPWRVALALQDDGWILRNDIIWHKPNAMPESVADRLGSRHEHLFLFAQQSRYWFDLAALREPVSGGAHGHSSTANARRFAITTQVTRGGRNGSPGSTLGQVTDTRAPGDVWSVGVARYPEAHFATFPADLPIRCIKAGCKPGGTVLDPFSGSGTTGEAARMLGRRYVGIDLNPAYHDLATKRFEQPVLDFETTEASP